jgi:cytochrome c peroxidase
MKDALKSFLLFCSLLCIFIAAASHDKTDVGVRESTVRFRSDSKAFAASITSLDSVLQQLDSSKPETITRAKTALIASRVAYKRIEYLLEYFFYTSSRVYNRAPKNEIEEPYLEYQEPAGLQYIEAMIFDSMPESHRAAFKQQTKLLSLSASDLNALLYQFKGNDKQLLEAVRIELIRIITLGITGYDAPLLKSGIKESEAALESVQKALSPYLEREKTSSNRVPFYLNQSLQYLHQHPDFNTFDRLKFLTAYMIPLQKHLGKMIQDMGLEINKSGILNYKAENIFSKNAFSDSAFSNQKNRVSTSRIKLGKRLFSENALSGNSSKSCVSCHNPENYFMDGLSKSVGFDQKSSAKRNAPSLLYAKYQHSQFWDGRAKTLEEQIAAVMKEPTEMNGTIETVLVKLNSDKTYRKSFQKAFSKNKKDKIKADELYQAIASYVGALNPYNAAFDQYIQGNTKALTDEQISGFNLFMGKAQCATCHFAPLFNGLIPPFYAFTEFEILGTTKTDLLTKPENDTDEGRFTFRPTPFYKNAFKTPTVRNTAKTAPYMHNGAFMSLETLMEFYNQGGGAGLGLAFPSQTLSAAKLNLTEKEKKDIIAFLNALTDDLNDL